jgi:hypothetical protein
MTATYEHKTQLAGDDYQGLPTTPVRYRGAPKPIGIDWEQVTADYIAAGGQVDASVWPRHGKVVVIGGSANSSKANIHTFTEATEYGEPAAEPKQAKKPRVRKPRTRKAATATSAMPQVYQVQPEQRPEIRRRYEQGESGPALARAYDVSEGSIRYAIEAAGGRLRSKSEAAALKFRNKK